MTPITTTATAQTTPIIIVIFEDVCCLERLTGRCGFLSPGLDVTGLIVPDFEIPDLEAEISYLLSEAAGLGAGLGAALTCGALVTGTLLTGALAGC